jgi:hypothetical protein
MIKRAIARRMASMVKNSRFRPDLFLISNVMAPTFDPTGSRCRALRHNVSPVIIAFPASSTGGYHDR